MLEVHDLTLGYGGEPVLEGFDLHVEPGRFVSLVGPSGSGKTSVLRAVSGLHARHRGSIRLGVPSDQVGFLFQDDALLPWRTARENVALGLRIHGAPKSESLERAEVWLGRIGLVHLGDRYPRELSGGQRKRVAIAQVLALEPRLLLMDEPFASLDAIVRHRLTSDLLTWVESERLTVLLVTHDLEEAVALSDEVVLLGGGPRARIRRRFEIPLPRPRDLLSARTHPSVAPLLRQLWADLADEVDEGRTPPNPADDAVHREAA